MLEPIVDSAAVAWPLALSLATVALVDRRRASRRRVSLNAAMHELRRPLQALVLEADRHPGRTGAAGLVPGHLDLALDALGGLEREINGGGERRPPLRPCDLRVLTLAAASRWRHAAAAAGRRLVCEWCAAEALLLGDPVLLSRALDNLIANALEHGRGPIRLEARCSARTLRISVLDSGRAPARGARRSPARGLRGHGLRIVRAIAERHGGSSGFERSPSGGEGWLELPLAG